jgi:hypothetical protein
VGHAGTGGASWAREKERGELGPHGKVGPAGLGGFLVWADRVFCFSYFLSPFSFKPTQIYLNSNSYAFKQNKTLHQHECNNKFKPRKILITCETKLD